MSEMTDSNETNISSGSIQQSRQSALFDAIGFVQQKIKKYQGPKIHCKSRHGGQVLAEKNAACDALMLGSLLRGSAAMGIWPAPSPPFSAMSWKSTASRIRDLKVVSVCDEFYSHSTWNPKAPDPSHGVKASILEVIDTLEERMTGLELASFKF